MGFFTKTGTLLGHIFNFRVDKWVGYSHIKNTAKIFIDAGKELIQIQKEKYPEDFASATERLALTPEVLKTQARRYKLFAYLFVTLGALVLGYAILLYIYHNIMGSIMTFALALYVFTNAFRYHFWYFQITQSKLGCTLKEWLLFLFSFYSRKHS